MKKDQLKKAPKKNKLEEAVKKYEGAEEISQEQAEIEAVKFDEKPEIVINNGFQKIELKSCTAGAIVYNSEEKPSLPSNPDIIIDSVVFQAFNDTTYINFNNVVEIRLKEYSQPSNNVFLWFYEFEKVSGKTIESPKFQSKDELNNWLNEIKRKNH